MDLIYMNSDHEDVGVLLDYEMDMAFGADENNFECAVNMNDHCCSSGFYLYMEGTEYGGMIDGIEIKTDTKDVIYSGRTWHGMLHSKIIVPLQNGEASTSAVTVKTTDASGASLVDRYLILSGDANACIQFVLSRIGLESLFVTSEAAAGININQYQFSRYTDAYNGLCKMLASAGAKLHIRCEGGMIVVSAAEKYDYSQDEQFDSDLVEFDLKKKQNTVNHLICLGTGELEDRMIVHLYADDDGNISQVQSQFGLDEYVSVYDYSSVESEEELISSGTEHLKSLWGTDELTIDFDATSDSFDVGDKVGAFDNVSGITVAAEIKKKIVTIKDGQITISYDVGE